MNIDRIRTSGQITLEYLILFAVIAAVTLISMTKFDNQVATSLQGFFTKAANAISK